MFYFDFPIQIQSFLNHYWLLVNYLLFFLLCTLAYIAYKKPVAACGILIILFPTYLFRAKIFGLPTTFLELSFLVVFSVWIIKMLWAQSSELRAPLKYPIALLFTASTISIFIAPNTTAALGLWKAYFIEPVLLFFLFIHVIKTEKDKEFIFWCLGISTIPLSLLAIFQKFTGWGIAEPMWVSEGVRRVTAIFTSPNAVGLYLGPITVMYFGWIIERFKISARGGSASGGKDTILKFPKKETSLKKLALHAVIFIILLLNIAAIIFTRSQGAWIGVVAGIIFLCYFLLNKKWTIVFSAGAIILFLLIPQTQKMILPHISFSDPAGQNRLQLWKGSADYLFTSPKNFFFGAGIHGFPQIQEKFRDPKKTEPLIYPHNFFLNFWMETGLLGLIAIIWILFNFFKKAQGPEPRAQSYLLMAAILTLLIHGLVDVPYFKNDLAMLFWTFLALVYLP